MNNEQKEEIKKHVSPIVSMIKELNSQLKEDEINYDFLLKFSTSLKVSSINLEKIVKQNKNKLNGGLKDK